MVGPRYDEARWVPAPASAAAAPHPQAEVKGQRTLPPRALPAVAEAKGAHDVVELIDVRTRLKAKRARVQQLRGELAVLTTQVQKTQRKGDALEPLLQLQEAGAVKVVSTADTAARVARTKTALQALQEEMRRLDVRIGVAQHLLLFDWGRRAARDKEHGDAGGGLSLLLQSDPEGDGDGLEEDEDEYGDE